MSNIHTVKDMRAKFKQAGKFYTPPELVTELHKLIPEGHQVERAYDPTCGAGNLLAPFPDTVEKYGQDIEAEAVAEAEMNIPNFHGYVGDVLADPAWADQRFDTIIANPPFSIKWEPDETDPRFTVAPAVPTKSKADYAFILHCLHMLTSDGIAVIMNFPGVLYRGNREGKIRRWLVEENYVHEVHHYPGNQFTDTTIATCVLVLRKDRQAGDPVLFVDHEHDLSESVSRESIAGNEYTLSVSSFVTPPVEEREPFDAFQTEMQAQNKIVRDLVKGIRFTKMVAQLEGEPRWVDLLLARVELALLDERHSWLEEGGDAA